MPWQLEILRLMSSFHFKFCCSTVPRRSELLILFSSTPLAMRWTGWNGHVEHITKKVAKRLYIIRILKRSGVPEDDLISIYISLILSIQDYACAVWHTRLTCYLVEMIERIQKHFFRIIYPGLSCQDALALTESPSIEDNRQKLCFKLFNNLITQPGSKLSHLKDIGNENFYSLN